MKFIERIRIKLGLSKADMARELGRSAQAYRSLELSKESILVTDIAALRRLITDNELLDELDREAEELRRRAKKK